MVVAPTVACESADATCAVPEAGDVTGNAAGTLAVAWDGGPTRTLSKTGGLVDMQLASGAIWGIGDLGQGTPNTIVRVDTSTGKATTVAGGGTITDFAVDGSGLYWVRDGKLLATPF